MSQLASEYEATRTWSDASFAKFERLLYAAIAQRERLAIRLTTNHLLYSLYSSALGSLDALVDFFGEDVKGTSADASKARVQAITTRAIEAQNEFLNSAAAIAGTALPEH